MIVGAGGQLGRALVEAAPPDRAPAAFSSAQLDISDREAVACAIGEVKPDIVFNAAAYTAVDRAEEDEARAFANNAEGVGHLAEACAANSARLVHVSTDFVFDGSSGHRYRPDDPTSPLSVYGRSKLAGEAAAGESALIVRTSWVYAALGANFVNTMLRLMAERDEVRVVADQIGSPTWARSLAEALWGLAAQGLHGRYHYVDAGVASWYDFAVAIAEEGRAAGLLKRSVRVVPISTQDYPTPAIRPAFSVLNPSEAYDALGRPARHWRSNLRKMLEEQRD